MLVPFKNCFLVQGFVLFADEGVSADMEFSCSDPSESTVPACSMDGGGGLVCTCTGYACNSAQFAVGKLREAKHAEEFARQQEEAEEAGAVSVTSEPTVAVETTMVEKSRATKGGQTSYCWSASVAILGLLISRYNR